MGHCDNGIWLVRVDSLLNRINRGHEINPGIGLVVYYTGRTEQLSRRILFGSALLRVATAFSARQDEHTPLVGVLYQAGAADLAVIWMRADC
jgi:hypothetical protein